ncbi:MAG: alpha-L-fucosidase [Akkermansiaceae bacterium]|jgi:alpha-L-fucosidase|nr:alpha-L-fucosidase [Akkermansiaceae bacterium]
MMSAAPLFSASLAFALTAAAVPPPAPHGALPTPAQVKHAERPYYAFCHFTVNTFMGREWGSGGESESVFNPTEFDADQIIGALKAGGAEGMILTCKHHDGFCLWPTTTTPHNVSKSPFRAGKGDVVREFVDACRRHGLEFGVYVSPWDRNNEHYGKPEYVTQVFRKQIEELLTGYGPVFEVWFDGANGGTGYYKGLVGPVESKDVNERRNIDRTTYYGWPETWAMVLRHQPDAIIFSDVGPGVRWVGNERGYAPDPCRPTITYPAGSTAGVSIPNLGSGTLGGKQWVPAEVDVSIRPGWFWHAHENGKVRSPENLMQIYMDSIGRGATLNLNVPPDRRGLLHENDVASLRQFGEHLTRTFAANLAAGAVPTASNIRGNDSSYGPQQMLDADPWSAWVSDDSVTTPEVVFTLPAARTFNLIRLREDIRLGLRLEGVAVDAWIDGQWRELAKAEAIGQSRLWRVPATTTNKVRVRVTKSPVCPALSDFGLFLEPEFPVWVPPVGGDPKAAAKAKWKILAASWQNPPGGAARHAIDGRPDTIWHTHGDDGERTLPQHLAIDLGEDKTLKGFTYLPRQDGTPHGMVDRYEFFVSIDGQTWRQVAAGEFGNLRANPVEQTVTFPPAKARYIKFVATRALEKNHAVVAELGVIEAGG